jgi:rhodanese-related sulfurtransferase
LSFVFLWNLEPAVMTRWRGKWGGRSDFETYHVIFCLALVGEQLWAMVFMKPTTLRFHKVASAFPTHRLGLMTSTVLFLIALCLGCFVHSACSYVTLTPEQFYSLKDSVNAVFDVRTLSEWDSGHIEGAMHVDSLSLYGTSSQISSPADLAGCEHCDIIVYCRFGARAVQALAHLEAAGFVGNLYNGLGVSQWTAANYPLVANSPSTPASCTVNTTASSQCLAK